MSNDQFPMKRIKHLNILPPTLLLALSALFSSFLGIARDHLLAKNFGATAGDGIYNLDVYYAAFRIPDLLYLILVMGAISAAFIPIFTKYKKSGDLDEAWKFASTMLHLLLIVISVVAVVAFIFAPQLTNLVAAGFSDESFDLTVRLMRIMLLSPIIFTFSSVFISIQDSFKSFFFRSLTPIFYNLGIVLAVIFFSDQFGVVGVTWGVVLGAVLALLIQLPSLWQVGYKHVWIIDYKRSDVREAFRLMLPRVLAMSMYQISLLVYTLMASFLVTGSITVLYFANNIYALPLAIIALSFSITSFATFSELATEPTTEPFTREIKSVMQQVLFLVFPATVGVILLRYEMIDAILVVGKFTPRDAVLTAQVLLPMILSLFTHSLILLLMRGFYAYQNTKTPFWASFWGAVLGVVLAYVFAFRYGMGVVGIGAAIAISNVLVFAVMYLLMRRRLGRNLLDWLNVSKMLLASIAMGLVLVYAKTLVHYPYELAAKFVYIVSLSLFGVVVYFLFSHIFKIPEREMIMGQVKGMK